MHSLAFGVGRWSRMTIRDTNQIVFTALNSSGFARSCHMIIAAHYFMNRARLSTNWKVTIFGHTLEGGHGRSSATECE
jgi:hypothetical protein